MCGIAGILARNSQEVSYEKLKRMTDIISHRGPDGEGHWISDSGNVGFGHRRLSILDLSEAGKQPMHYLDRYTITFNGEIYNYVELKEKLVSKGYKFRSTSDTEVLLALYDHHKEECLQLLDGMFAFAIWDQVEQTLFCARDRFGEKPFYYSYKEGEFFVFGSEMKELWEAGIERTMSNKMIYNFLINGYVENPWDLTMTYFEKISKLKAGHCIKIKFPELKINIKKYWDIDITKRTNISLDQASERFRELFYQSVSRRLRSDVPVGSSLSGGLDSSIVVRVIDEFNKDQSFNLNTFSARFPGYSKDEGPYMQMVIDKSKVAPHFVFPSDSSMMEELDDVCFYQEEPFGSASICAQYEVMRLAKENNVTVMLDGQGADEILAGYHMYYYSFFNELEKNNPAEYKRQLQAYQEIHKDNKINSIIERSAFKNFLKSSLPFLVSPIKKLRYAMQKDERMFLNSDFLKKNAFGEFPGEYELNEALYKSTFGGGLEELLRYGDRSSMAHSREVRLPFLNHELVEFIFSLPSVYKINEGWTKYIERTAFEYTLPKDVCWRKDKIGYEPPQKKWMKEPKVKEQIEQTLRELSEDKILSSNIDQVLHAYNNGQYSEFFWRCWNVGKIKKMDVRGKIKKSQLV